VLPLCFLSILSISFGFLLSFFLNSCFFFLYFCFFFLLNSCFTSPINHPTSIVIDGVRLFGSVGGAGKDAGCGGFWVCGRGSRRELQCWWFGWLLFS
jgi:hypothetical protein